MWLVVDGNYLLNRSSWALWSAKLLYGDLHKLLEINIANYKKSAPWSRKIMVEDSGRSWRCSVDPSYKSARREKAKDVDSPDWEFINNTWNDMWNTDTFNGWERFSHTGLEGDDWIARVEMLAREAGESLVIVTGDYDILQLLHWDSKRVSVLWRDTRENPKLFIPLGLDVWKADIEKRGRSLWDDNGEFEMIDWLNREMGRCEVIPVVPEEKLFIKLISGDKSDSVSSVMLLEQKNGKLRGIGEKGAEKIMQEFNPIEIDWSSELWLQRIAKTVSYKYPNKYDEVLEKIKLNLKLIKLNQLPENLQTEIIKLK